MENKNSIRNRTITEKHEQRIERLVNDYEQRIMKHLNEEYSRTTKYSDRLADQIAAFGGSWKFIIYFSIFLVAWMIWNVLQITKVLHFDEPPFILLNLILSSLAAFQAPIIMMSQNRQAARDKREAMIDFAINYKAEQEIDYVQRHLHHIEDELRKVRKENQELRDLLQTLISQNKK
ncbi:DUF1003 domain-containing protein [Ectobacillus panaciterrae]|uniref:DUF1003 domain-containing protein n=1 Tax=Ectobacillus panaciterrae TaxID=363872 RepID=UPI000422C592|nr:DUF1003 domain-containing protein [Ectobacillus panaciterrae]